MKTVSVPHDDSLCLVATGVRPKSKGFDCFDSEVGGWFLRGEPATVLIRSCQYIPPESDRQAAARIAAKALGVNVECIRTGRNSERYHSCMEISKRLGLSGLPPIAHDGNPKFICMQDIGYWLGPVMCVNCKQFFDVGDNWDQWCYYREWAGLFTTPPIVCSWKCRNASRDGLITPPSEDKSWRRKQQAQQSRALRKLTAKAKEALRNSDLAALRSVETEFTRVVSLPDS